ncbi:MAG: hypothetical protein ABI612_23215, partial [Betaproteobacteria bacterium]
RCGGAPMARSLVAERVAMRPQSLFNQHLLDRLGGKPLSLTRDDWNAGMRDRLPGATGIAAKARMFEAA